jgi:hypothetical protein
MTHIKMEKNAEVWKLFYFTFKSYAIVINVRIDILIYILLSLYKNKWLVSAVWLFKAVQRNWLVLANKCFKIIDGLLFQNRTEQNIYFI